MTTFQTVLAEVQLEWSKDDLSAVTRRKYVSYLKRLAWQVPFVNEEWQVLPAAEVEENLTRWRDDMERKRKSVDPAQQVSASTISTERSALVKFFDALVLLKRYAYNPARKIKGAYTVEGDPRPLAMEWVQRLFMQPDVTNIAGLRDLTMLHLYMHALRVGEVCALTLGDIHLDQTHHHVTLRLKGTSRRARTDTSPPLKPDSLAVLVRFLLWRFVPTEWEAWYTRFGDDEARLVHLLTLFGRDGKHEPLFLHYGRRVQSMSTREAERAFALLRDRAGVPKEVLDVAVGPHTLRHTILTEVLRASKDLRTTQEIARHADIRMTQRYTKVIGEQKATALALVPLPSREL